MKKSIMVVIILLSFHRGKIYSTDLLQEMDSCLTEKCDFIKKHDTLQVLPRIITICNQLQEICKESPTICKERRFALDRELAILMQLYFKQLPEEEIATLKDIIKKYHTVQQKLFLMSDKQQYSKRQKHYIELIFI